MNKRTAYLCPSCDSDHPTAKLALECCFKPEFNCPVCNSAREDKYDAIACCAETLEPVLLPIFVCTECKWEYKTKQEAKDCCLADQEVSHD